MQLGIDIGTCYSKAALLLDNGTMQLIGQNKGFPSSIYIDSHNNFVFGQDAEDRQLIDPGCYQSAFKANLGSRDKRTYLLRISPDELLSRIRLLCRNLKHQLSSSWQAQLVADTYAFQNAPTTYILTRDQLEQMLKPLLMQTIQYCRALVHQAQIRWENVSQVLLV